MPYTIIVEGVANVQYIKINKTCYISNSTAISLSSMFLAYVGGKGGKCRVNSLLRQNEMAGITGPFTSLNCNPSDSPFLTQKQRETMESIVSINLKVLDRSIPSTVRVLQRNLRVYNTVGQ